MNSRSRVIGSECLDFGCSVSDKARINVFGGGGKAIACHLMKMEVLRKLQDFSTLSNRGSVKN